MFRIMQLPTIDWPVEVNVPQSGGGVQKHKFTARFEIVPTQEYEALVGEGEGVSAALDRVLVGWGTDVKGETGDEPLEFNPENKAQMLRTPYARVGLLRAYIQAAAGQEARRKN